MMIALTGFVAGSTHILAGPDHLAALAPFAVAEPRRAVRIGLQWAVGHTAGVGLVAAASLLLREFIPVNLISSYSERAVGVLLIGIGIWGLRRAFATRIHAHEHAHDGAPHTHIHVHRSGHPQDERPTHLHSHAVLGIGTLHGLAGGSHLLGVLPALALPSRWAAVAYLVSFGLGTLAGMGVFSSALGLIANPKGGAGARACQYLMSGSAWAALVVGCVWLLM